MKWLALVLVLAACHRGEKSDPNADKPSSCIIEHDGGVTQCFEEVGQAAKREGKQLCDRMHGKHTYRVGEACPVDGVVASCTKRPGTDLERTEQCYRDEPACAARCAKNEGAVYKKSY